MAVNHVRIDPGGVEIQAAPHRTKDRLQVLRAAKLARVDRKTAHLQVGSIHDLVTEGAHVHLHQFGQFTTEVIHMHARAAVNGGRVFVC